MKKNCSFYWRISGNFIYDYFVSFWYNLSRIQIVRI